MITWDIPEKNPSKKIKEREDLWRKMAEWEEINGKIECDLLKGSVGELTNSQKADAKLKAEANSGRKRIEFSSKKRRGH